MAREITARWLTESLKLPKGDDARHYAQNHIKSALMRSAGNVAGAADALGVGRATLNRWLATNDVLAHALENARKRGIAE
jgi:transcriptional regulator with PAS, ATPase and Fis domain